MATPNFSACSCLPVTSTVRCPPFQKSQISVSGMAPSTAEHSCGQKEKRSSNLLSSYYCFQRKFFLVGACSGARSLLTGPSAFGHKTNRRLFSIMCKAYRSRIGRVGTHEREGNVTLAFFGARRKKGIDWKKVDFAKALSGLLPYVVLATAAAALAQPATFTWVTKEYYAPALGGIMLSIGVQLSVRDFAVALQRPLPVLVGYSAQYICKPLLGLVVAKIFRIPSAFAAGFLLTASVAGAQLCSYASYLSEGDVALSIVLTSLSTITSVVVTPVLTGLLIGAVVPVDGFAMAKSIMQVVLFPVAIGLVMNTYARSTVDTIRPLMPLIAMICTSICIGSPLALNRARIVSVEGIQLLLPIVLFHTSAFALGYWISKLPILRQEERVSRTLSLSTGMQSSTLAGLLATQFLGSSQAVPPACSVVVMAVMGLSLASFWGKGNRISTLLDHGIGRIMSCEDAYMKAVPGD